MALAALLAPAAAHAGAERRLVPRIVNGRLTQDYPSVAALLRIDEFGTVETFCSATLIGCRTVLTAAHCVCGRKDEPNCSALGLPDAFVSESAVALQHGGLVTIEQAFVHPAFEFEVAADVAVLRLADRVTGIRPAPINDVASPSFGSAGTVAGFGLTDARRFDSGVKRAGRVTTGTCLPPVPNETHVCWRFAGSGSNTCSGDSGGPLFVDFGFGDLVAGVTSGGDSDTCQAIDNSFDADVFRYRAWIADRAGSDLGDTCGDFAPVGRAGTTVPLAKTATLDASQPADEHVFQVAPGTKLLRVALNGEDAGEGFPGIPEANDFDLYVRFGSPASPEFSDCQDDAPGPYGFCEIERPDAGPWFVTVRWFDGPGGLYQITATSFGTAAPASQTPTRTTTRTPTASRTATRTPTRTQTRTRTPSPTPSATPSATRSPTPPPTRTATPLPTHTPTRRPTRTPGPCFGDCDGDGRVTIDELVRGVREALFESRAPSSLCADANGDLHVTIDDLLAAVGVSLSGCTPQ